jgi:excisionase family DNA binding protein
MRMAKIDTPYMTAQEAMRYLKVESSSNLYRLIREHRLPFCRRGRSYLFHRDELDVWLHGFTSEIEMVRAKKRA